MLLFLVAHYSFGQQINGILKSWEDHKPLSHASIKLGKRGTISDSEGKFTLSTQETDWQQNLTIHISYIGYHGISIPIKSFKNNETILLKTQSQDLQEVIVSSSARDLVKKAIEAIPRNYPQNKLIITGNYVETIMKNKFDTAYKIAFQINSQLSYKEGENQKSRDKITQYAKTMAINLDTSALVNWYGEGKTLEKLDLVRRREKFLNSNRQKKYNYKLIDILSINGRETYQVQFNLKSDPKLEEGNIYIDEESFAIIRFDFIENPKNSVRDKDGQIVAEVNYKPYKKGWIIDNLSFSHAAKVQNIYGYAWINFQNIEIVQNSEIRNIPFSQKVYEDDFMIKMAIPSSIKTDENLLNKIKLVETIKNNPKDSLFRFRKIFSNFKLGLRRRSFSTPLQFSQTNQTQLNNYWNSVANVNYQLNDAFPLIYKAGFGLAYKNLNFYIEKIMNNLYGFNQFNGNTLELSYQLKFNKKNRPMFIIPNIGRSKLKTFQWLQNFTPSEEFQKKYTLQNEEYNASQLITSYSYTAGINLGIMLTRKKSLEIGFRYHTINHWTEYLEVGLNSRSLLGKIFSTGLQTIEPSIPLVSNIPNQITYNLTYNF